MSETENRDREKEKEREEIIFLPFIYGTCPSPNSTHTEQTPVINKLSLFLNTPSIRMLQFLASLMALIISIPLGWLDSLFHRLTSRSRHKFFTNGFGDLGRLYELERTVFANASSTGNTSNSSSSSSSSSGDSGSGGSSGSFGGRNNNNNNNNNNNTGTIATADGNALRARTRTLLASCLSDFKPRLTSQKVDKSWLGAFPIENYEFDTPQMIAASLNPESATGRAQVMLPAPGAPIRGFAVHLAATGDQGFGMRRQLVARWLARRSIGSIMLQIPTYGHRRPARQLSHYCSDLALYLSASYACMLEGACLGHWAQSQWNNVPVVYTGISYGGAMATG